MQEKKKVRRSGSGWNFVPRSLLLATFRLEHEDEYEYEFKVLSTRTSKIFARQT